MSSFGLNRYSFIGRIGSVRTVENVEKPFTSVSVAIDESYTPQGGEKVERVKWVECIVSGINQVSNLVVGRNVLVEGVPSAEAFMKDGEPTATLKVKGATISYLDKKPE